MRLTSLFAKLNRFEADVTDKLHNNSVKQSGSIIVEQQSNYLSIFHQGEAIINGNHVAISNQHIWQDDGNLWLRRFCYDSEAEIEFTEQENAYQGAVYHCGQDSYRANLSLIPSVTLQWQIIGPNKDLQVVMRYSKTHSL